MRLRHLALIPLLALIAACASPSAAAPAQPAPAAAPGGVTLSAPQLQQLELMVMHATMSDEGRNTLAQLDALAKQQAAPPAPAPTPVPKAK